jgi:hypothetical protein
MMIQNNEDDNDDLRDISDGFDDHIEYDDIDAIIVKLIYSMMTEY